MSSELEPGAAVAASVVNGPPLVTDVEFQAQLDDAVQVLRHRGQTTMADLALILPRLQLRTATWFLGDGVRSAMEVDGDPALFDEFRLSVRRHILDFQRIGCLDHVISGNVPLLVLQEALQLAARLAYDDDGGGIGAVPASVAAVRSLEKQTFHAASTGGSDDDGAVAECNICFKEFVDGGQVSVLPCPSLGHKFHPDCIAKWLGVSNMCPLCRHELPPAD